MVFKTSRILFLEILTVLGLLALVLECAGAARVKYAVERARAGRAEALLLLKVGCRVGRVG